MYSFCRGLASQIFLENPGRSFPDYTIFSYCKLVKLVLQGLCQVSSISCCSSQAPLDHGWHSLSVKWILENWLLRWLFRVGGPRNTLLKSKIHTFVFLLILEMPWLHFLFFGSKGLIFMVLISLITILSLALISYMIHSEPQFIS